MIDTVKFEQCLFYYQKRRIEMEILRTVIWILILLCLFTSTIYEIKVTLFIVLLLSSVDVIYSLLLRRKEVRHARN